MTQEETQTGEGESTEETESTQEDGSTTEEEKPEPRKYRVKGEGFDEDVDETTLVKGYQLERSSNERYKQSSELVKKVKPFIPIIEALKRNDLSVLKKLGVSKEAILRFSESELLAHIDHEALSPEERRAVEAEDNSKRYKAEIEAGKERDLKQYKAHLADKAADQIQGEFTEAFEELKIPMKGNSQLVSLTCQEVVKYQDAGKKLTVKAALKKVLNDLDENFSSYAQRQFEKDPVAFLKRLPKGMTDKIRKMDLETIDSQLPMGKQVDPNFNVKPRGKNSDEFVDYMKEELLKRG